MTEEAARHRWNERCSWDETSAPEESPRGARRGVWIPADPGGPGIARAYVRDQLADCRIDRERREIGALLVSELVTNAVRHGSPAPGARVWCSVRCTQTGVRLRVWGRTHTLPAPRLAAQSPDPLHEGGRGLLIVAAMSSHWGSRRGRSSLLVWADL